MNSFSYSKAVSIADALSRTGHFIAGGTNLLDLMKENVARPAHLTDINALPLDRIELLDGGGLRLGALARNAATAHHPEVRQRYPVLSAALLAGASPQIRNMASNGGNLLQRTRCLYFYDTATPCNKREPGTGCPAVTGLARQHAILGASTQCVATHPSDFCVALAVLNATVHVESAGESGFRSRTIAFADFHRLPQDRPQDDTTLRPGELIVAITLPPASQFAAHSTYLKFRERASYAFALVSVAALMDVDDSGVIREARIALGGVAHKPWRVAAAEQMLAGQPASRDLFEAAAHEMLRGAVPQGSGAGSNAFKIPMARRAVVRGLESALAGITTNVTGGAA